MKAIGLVPATTLMLLAASGASAQVAVSANDGKQLRPGETPAARTTDHVAVIDVGASPPRVLGRVDVSASLSGPPSTVAVSSDSRFAVLSGAQRVDPADAGKLAPHNALSVIDLADPAQPRVVQSLTAGLSPAGVAINRARTLALVANSGDDTVSVFTVRGRRLTPAGVIQLDPQSRPTDVAFTPDGRSAYVVAQTAGKLLRLAVSGTTVSRTTDAVVTGVQPSGVVISRDGRYAFNTNLGGRVAIDGTTPPAPKSGPRIGSISVVDLRDHRLVSSVDAGVTPEHLSLSPDGRFIEVNLVNGSSAATTSPSYNPYGLMKVFRLQDGLLTPAAETRTGQWCQGAVWRRDSRRILLQCALSKEIEAYDFDGSRLTRDPAATLAFDARPGAISSAVAR